jgi:hypothetical protein
MTADHERESQMIKPLQIARPQFLISGLALFVFGASWVILLGTPFSLSRIFFGCPGCQWDHDHSGGFLNPGGWICSFSSLWSDAINE